jgi:hypothetical protein
MRDGTLARRLNILAFELDGTLVGRAFPRPPPAGIGMPALQNVSNLDREAV